MGLLLIKPEKGLLGWLIARFWHTAATAVTVLKQNQDEDEQTRVGIYSQSKTHNLQ